MIVSLDLPLAKLGEPARFLAHQELLERFYLAFGAGLSHKN
jgi:hypothetical protein